MSIDELFKKFSPVFVSERAPEIRDGRLLMDTDGHLKIYYAPFEHINRQAKIALVGITPGPTQMVNANNAARAELAAGKPIASAIRAAKITASFSGEPMRSNLIKQLNHWRVHEWLGLRDAADLFGIASHLVHSTSLLRYPVFIDDKDYRGSPNMAKHPLLRSYLEKYFVSEVSELEDTVFLGLGPQVQSVLDILIEQGVLRPERVIGGMLHPSGNCTYRIKYLVGSRAGPVPHATNPEPYDVGRKAFADRFLSR